MAQLARVKVSNPTSAPIPKGSRMSTKPKKKRKKARTAKQKAATARMLAANKAKSGTSSATTKKRKAKKRPKKAAAAKSSAKRPRKTKKRAAAAKITAPKKRKGSKKGKKHAHWGKVKGHKRRTNPGIPTWALAGLAALAGISTYALFGAGSYALTQRTDPGMTSLERNRYIANAIATALGFGVTFVSPLIGAGIMVGGGVGLVGTDLYLALGKVLDKAPPAAPPPKALGGLYRDGEQQIAGLFRRGQQQIEAGEPQQIGGLYRVGGGSLQRQFD